MKEFEFECEDCGEEFTILATSNEKPSQCPFCGCDLNNTRKHDDDDNEEDEV